MCICVCVCVCMFNEIYANISGRGSEPDQAISRLTKLVIIYYTLILLKLE